MQKIRKGDEVVVLTGKDKGRKGSVLQVMPKDNRAVVSGVNIVKRHQRPSAQNRQGGIVEGEAPIHWSNVMVMCGKCVAPTRVRYQRLEDGKKVRACHKCGESLDA